MANALVPAGSDGGRPFSPLHLPPKQEGTPLSSLDEALAIILAWRAVRQLDRKQGIEYQWPWEDAVPSILGMLIALCVQRHATIHAVARAGLCEDSANGPSATSRWRCGSDIDLWLMLQRATKVRHCSAPERFSACSNVRQFGLLCLSSILGFRPMLPETARLNVNRFPLSRGILAIRYPLIPGYCIAPGRITAQAIPVGKNNMPRLLDHHVQHSW